MTGAGGILHIFNTSRVRELIHAETVVGLDKTPIEPIDPNTEDTGEWPVLKPEPDTRPKPDGRGGCT